ncbi:EVN093 [Ectromelia virus Naval]|uniref:Core protein VP8 n=2 Tax=Ectromelia virus TaxID=12643 RepID=A0A075IJG0_9POXV|nr:core package and transcription protein [Ectromelia virus ERPV]AIF30159.1 EVN093 [Ectromelia virus Naval]QSV39663.1 ss/dsDNA binding [Ectromelia virus WH]
MSLLLENLIEEDTIFFAGSISEYDDLQMVIAGAKSKFPRSMLSIFNIVPRTMSKYELVLIHNENITGAMFTTMYNIRNNLGLGDDKLTIEAIENYFLDPNNEVMPLIINNTDMTAVIPKKSGRRKNKNMVIFRQGSSPILCIFETRKKINIYKENMESAATEYTPIGDNKALISKYAGINTLNVYSPSTSMRLNAIYGFTNKNKLEKLSTNKELESYSSSPLQEPIRLNDFLGLLECVKKNIPLTDIPTKD